MTLILSIELEFLRKNGQLFDDDSTTGDVKKRLESFKKNYVEDVSL